MQNSNINDSNIWTNIKKNIIDYIQHLRINISDVSSIVKCTYYSLFPCNVRYSIVGTCVYILADSVPIISFIWLQVSLFKSYLHTSAPIIVCHVNFTGQLGGK